MKPSKPPEPPLHWIEENAWWILVFGLPALGGLFAHFANWKPAELIGLTAVLAAAAITAMGLLFWRRVRLAQTDASLKLTMLQRGLTPDEIERLLSADFRPPPVPPTDEQILEELATCLHQSGISETVIEKVLFGMSFVYG